MREHTCTHHGPNNCPACNDYPPDRIDFYATSASDMKRCAECGALVVGEKAIERHASIMHDGVVGRVGAGMRVY